MARHEVVAKLFSEGLPFLYGAHQQGAAQAAANCRTSTSPKLRQMLQSGHQANKEQARRLEQVFRSAGLTPHAKHDKAMQGIIDANNAMVSRTRDPASRDLLNIELGQVAAHFYLATYGTMRTYAKFLGNDEAAHLLQRTLDETGQIDKDLTSLAGHLAKRTRDHGRGSGAYDSASMHPAITVAAVIGLVAAGTALIGRGDWTSNPKGAGPRRPDQRGRPAATGGATP